MALKVCLNGQMKSLTGPNKAPIVFLDGQKKRLMKGITFINGQKHILWDSRDVSINIIPGVYSAIGKTPFKFVTTSREKLFVCSEDVRDGNLSRLNISNTSSPILENTVQNGTVMSYSTPDSGPSIMSFFGIVRTGSAANSQYNYKQTQINIKTDTMAAEVIHAATFTRHSAGYPIHLTEDGGFDLALAAALRRWYVYKNANRVYDIGTYPANLLNIIQPNLQKFNSSSGVGIYNRFTTSEMGIARFTEASASPFVINKSYIDCMVDSKQRIAAAGPTGFGVYASTGVAAFEKAPRASNRLCKLVGECRGYFYVLDIPEYKSNTDTGTVYLDVYDLNGTLITTKTIDLPFASASSYNATDKWTYAQTMPQISYTGALGFRWMNSPYHSDPLIVQILGY